jgi:hypothetical protein
MFKRNVGSADAIVRVLIAAILIGMAIIYDFKWGLIGLIPLVTGVSGLCPLYSIFGIRTCPAPKAAK